MKTIDIIIPVYKNELLTKECIDSLLENIDEISNLNPRIIAVNDSPEEPLISDLLQKYQEKIDNFIYIKNESNIGFVKSSNKALSHSIKRNSYALLINSDTITYPGTLINLWKAMQLDPMIGFACPRSNNASLATFPHKNPKHDDQSSTDKSYLTWCTTKKYLPFISFSPTIVGFYMLIRNTVLQNFGGFNEAFNYGYEEENDLVLRAGKFGYRCVLANHSYAHHVSAASFSLNKKINYENERRENLKKICKIHPEYFDLIKDYESGPQFKTEELIGDLHSNDSSKRDILINASNLGEFFNGTSQIIVLFIKHYLNIRGNDSISVYCNKKAFYFHGLNNIKNVFLISTPDKAYTASIMMGQPFTYGDIELMENSSAVNIYGMVDVIAEDCTQLKNKKLNLIWQHVAEYANGVFFPSNFSRITFLNRFTSNIPFLLTKLYPTNPKLYYDARLASKKKNFDNTYILVLGNHFAHKDSSRTGQFLAQNIQSLKIITLGSIFNKNNNYEELISGHLSGQSMFDLYANAKFIVLPSHYEGFGLGFMHALAHQKPIFAKKIGPTEEILEKFSHTFGVHLYESDSELLSLIHSHFDQKESLAICKSNDDWDDFFKAISNMIEDCIRDESIYLRSVKRLRETKLLIESENPPGTLLPCQFNSIHIQDLLQHEGNSFIEACYQILLRRPPDHRGLIHYQYFLKKKRAKLKILQSILRSNEYSLSPYKIKIRGLLLYKIINRFLPII